MNTDLNIFNAKNSEICNSSSFTELRISTLQEPILENYDIENLSPNIMNKNKNNSSQNDLCQSKSDSKNSLFSSEIKITYRPELFEEIENNNIDKISEILNKDISQLNEYNLEGYTPLHLSIIKGNINIIKLLLKKGANPNALSLSKNQTPLHFSYLNQNDNTDEIIKDLINHGAKQNLLDINNKKPSDYLNINESNSNLNSNNSLQKKISLNKNKEKLNNDIKKDNNSNCTNGSQNSDKNISETNSYETTIINSISTQKENKSNEGYNKTSLDSQKKINININDLITPIKYPCLANLKEESQNEKSSINDSLDIENISININNKSNENKENKENNLLSFQLQENDIKNYKSIQSNTSYNDNVDLTYTTSIIGELSNNKKNSSKKDSIKSILNSEDKKITNNNNNNSNKVVDNTDNTNIDEIYKSIIMKKRDSIAKTYKKKSNKIYLFTNGHGKSEKNKNKKISFQNNNNINNNNNILNNFNTNPNSTSSNKTFNKIILEYSPFSTDIQTGKNQINKKDNNNISVIEKKKSITEFKYDNSISEEDNNKNEHLTSLANEFVNKSNNLKTIDENINSNYNALKNWLSSIELQNCIDNFIKNDIYDINQLINRMKTFQTKLNINDIESLKIDKKGYCYRILLKLEIDAGLIDKKITNFMLNNVNLNSNITNKNRNHLKLSISQDYNNCFGCCKFNFLNSSKKNDLKCFLLRYGLMDLLQNFYHNGFDLITYVILQMYSDNPINEDILENCFHIYNYEKRNLVLKALLFEVKKINYFLDSNEYNDNPNKDLIKYENIIFDENQGKKYKLGQNKEGMCNDCLIF